MRMMASLAGENDDQSPVEDEDRTVVGDEASMLALDGASVMEEEEESFIMSQPVCQDDLADCL